MLLLYNLFIGSHTMEICNNTHKKNEYSRTVQVEFLMLWNKNIIFVQELVNFYGYVRCFFRWCLYNEES